MTNNKHSKTASHYITQPTISHIQSRQHNNNILIGLTAAIATLLCIIDVILYYPTSQSVIVAYLAKSRLQEWRKEYEILGHTLERELEAQHQSELDLYAQRQSRKIAEAKSTNLTVRIHLQQHLTELQTELIQMKVAGQRRIADLHQVCNRRREAQNRRWASVIYEYEAGEQQAQELEAPNEQSQINVATPGDQASASASSAQ